jgi:hypothetical protein
MVMIAVRIQESAKLRAAHVMSSYAGMGARRISATPLSANMTLLRRGCSLDCID